MDECHKSNAPHSTICSFLESLRERKRNYNKPTPQDFPKKEVLLGNCSSFLAVRTPCCVTHEKE